MTLDRDSAADISGLPLFYGLSASEIWTAQSVLHRKEVPAGQELMAEQEAGEIVYIIARGAVRICVKRGAQNIIIALRGVGDVLGEMSVIDGDKRSATVITQSDCSFWWVSRVDFWEVLWPMPPFALNLTALLARRIRGLTSQLEAMATLPVAGRLALLLGSLARDYGLPAALDWAPNAVEIPFRLTQGDLASMIAATRAQVCQVESAWKKRGLIRVHKARLHVLDEAALRALAT